MSDEPLTSYDVDRPRGRAAAARTGPKVRNAINTPMLEELLAHIADRQRTTRTVRVLVISSTDHMGLSAGADVTEDLDRDGAVRKMQLFADLYDAIVGFPKPTIAACHGAVVGGGAEIAVACDLRVGGSNLRLRFPGAGLGVPVGPARLVTLCGLSVAKYLLLTSKEVGGRRGAPLGPRPQGRPGATDRGGGAPARRAGRRSTRPSRSRGSSGCSTSGTGSRTAPAPRARARSPGRARARASATPTEWRPRRRTRSGPCSSSPEEIARICAARVESLGRRRRAPITRGECLAGRPPVPARRARRGRAGPGRQADPVRRRRRPRRPRPRPRARRLPRSAPRPSLPSRGTGYESHLAPPPHLVGLRIAALDALAAADRDGGGDAARRAPAPSRSPRRCPTPRCARPASRFSRGGGRSRRRRRAARRRGYERVEQVADRGQFAVRGGILDVFGATEDAPRGSSCSATRSSRSAGSRPSPSARSASRADRARARRRDRPRPPARWPRGARRADPRRTATPARSPSSCRPIASPHSSI